MVEAETIDELKPALLEVAYRELREKGPDVSARDFRGHVEHCWYIWRDATIQEQARRTAANVPHGKLVSLWPTVHRLLWGFKFYCRPEQIEIFDVDPDHQSLLMGWYLAELRYYNKIEKGLLRPVIISLEEAEEWLENQAWLVNLGNAAQPGLPFG